MKRIALNLMLVSGFFLVLSTSAFAQRHGGGGGEGRMSAGGGNSAPAIHSDAPATHNEAPAIQNGNMNHNDTNHGMAYGPNNHPFYGSDHGQGNDWRYRYDNNRWWYYGALGAWAYWNDGRWVDYGTPYTTAYRGPSAASGWYWSNDAHRWFWFDGSTLTASQQ